MFNDFIDWAARLERDQDPRRMAVSVHVDEAADQACAQLDLVTSARVAKVVCWRSNDFEAEVVELADGRVLYVKCGTLIAEASVQFEPVLEFLLDPCLVPAPLWGEG